jgi:hypothetical protein
MPVLRLASGRVAAKSCPESAGAERTSQIEVESGLESQLAGGTHPQSSRAGAAHEQTIRSRALPGSLEALNCPPAPPGRFI